MQSSDLVRAVAVKSGLTTAQVSEVLDSLIEVISEQVHSGPVNVPHLGKVVLTTRAATAERKSVHPRTGAPITLPAKPARTVPKIRLGSHFVNLVQDAAGRASAQAQAQTGNPTGTQAVTSEG